MSCFVTASLAGLAAVLVPVVSQASAASSPAAVVLPANRPAPVPHGAVRLGAVASKTALHMDVTLRVRDQAGLTSYIAALSNRKSALFHHYLTPGQFAARFGATSAQIATVEAALRAQGLTPGKVSANRLEIPVTATAAAAERAFGVSLSNYRLTGGKVGYDNSAAPKVPAAAAPYVQSVVGLSTVTREQSMLARPSAPYAVRPSTSTRLARASTTTGPQPCTDASNAGITANEFAAYYNMTPLYGLNDLGKGVTVALAEFEPYSASDIATYKSCYGVSTAVNNITVDGGAGTGAGSGEAALDIEDVLGLAPDVTIDVYEAPNSDTGSLDLFNQIVTADTAKVVSTSWGLCELDSDSSLISSEQPLFEEAATQGQTVLAAAGDFGSTACEPDGTSNDGSLSVSDPASQPYVVGVGGTSIGTTSENVWNDSSTQEGAGGGGVSADWCMPTYQGPTNATTGDTIPGVINADSVTNSSCPTGYMRQVPDVSADADPETGYAIFWDGSWGLFGGTSAAAPLWAAVAALIDASPFCSDYGSGDAGVQPLGLYAVASADSSYIYTGGAGLYDVTSGNNDYTPSGYTGGLYPATTDYDMASGLGTPLLTTYLSATEVSWYYPGLAALMCEHYATTKMQSTTVTGISPNKGPTSKSTTVTVTGTGFLPIAGADMAKIGSKQIAASCSSTTKCTVKLPTMKAGTVHIQMSAEDFPFSSATSKASEFQYVSAPTVKSLSPNHGSSRGRTKITIRGTNFIGVTSVHFGSKKGTKLKVVSSTEIIVYTPSGSGTVKVTVTAAGGTSKVVTASHYRY